MADGSVDLTILGDLAKAGLFHERRDPGAEFAEGLTIQRTLTGGVVIVHLTVGTMRARMIAAPGRNPVLDIVPSGAAMDAQGWDREARTAFRRMLNELAGR